jgi:hypothetical protein
MVYGPSLGSWVAPLHSPSFSCGTHLHTSVSRGALPQKRAPAVVVARRVVNPLEIIAETRVGLLKLQSIVEIA